MTTCTVRQARLAEAYELAHCGVRFETPAAQVDLTGTATCPICSESLIVEWKQARG